MPERRETGRPSGAPLLRNCARAPQLRHQRIGNKLPALTVLAYDGDPQPVIWAMALANPKLPGLPDVVRQQGRAGSPLPATGGASVPASRDRLSKQTLAATARPKKKTKAREDARPTGRKSIWPKALAERVQAVETALYAAAGPTAPAELAKQFKRANPAAVLEILQTLVTLGRAREQGGKFTR